MKNFRNLKVWDQAHTITLRVYRMSAIFPREATLWFDQPDSTMQCLDRRQHCRRLRSAWKWRVPPFPTDGVRVGERTRL